MCAAHERTPLSAVRQVVQLYRECERLLHRAIVPPLSALSNMTEQMHVVATVLRRRAHVVCTTELPTATTTHSLRASSSALSPSSSSSYAVAAAPLGVLAAFVPSTLEHVAAVHARDRAALLHSLSEAQQRWHRNMQQLQRRVTTLEEAWSSASSSLSSVYSHVYCHDDDDTSASATTQQQQQLLLLRDDERRLTGLQTRSQVLAAVYGIVGAVTKMDCVLQECVLALRHDLLHTTLLAHGDDGGSDDDGQGGRAACALAALYAREAHDSVARIAQRIDSDDDSSNNKSNNVVVDDNGSAVAALRRVDDALQSALASAPRRATSLSAALDAAAPFVEACWRNATRAFSCEETRILLS